MGTASDTPVKVSVVVPAYNMAEYLDEAIRSVLRGTFQNLEIIVTDDGSTDATRSIVAEYTDPSRSKYDPRVHYEYQDNSGKSAAVNQGLKTARGAYVVMLDADDQLTSQSLKSRLEVVVDDESGELYDLIIGGFEVFDHRRTYGERPAPRISDPKQLHKRFYLHWKTPFHLNACLISRSLIDKVGGLDETIHRCIDGDYALRLLHEAESVKVVDDIVYRYRKHRSSPLGRIRYRLKTARYRPNVVWKNYDGLRRYAAVPFGLALDAGKLIYEVFDSYKE